MALYLYVCCSGWSTERAERACRGALLRNKTTSSDQSLTTKNTTVAVISDKYRELSSEEKETMMNTLQRGVAAYGKA